ncbi:hypothetical protein SAMN05444161_5296 [Rhizobiales bacterium GAS191]|nr:hypothetical protein SAMN05444161_5296 [Rhizobiales bacterium GAS191]
MTPAEWERCLTCHYLRSDGPLGGSPLTFLDATPSELAAAAVEHGITENVAQGEFVSGFNPRTVQAWLNGDHAPPARDGELPGYFRYLVLTALVSATEEGVGRNHDFRDRLGALFGAGRLNSVSGVNVLWRALVGWCERRRAAGEPIRPVVLPSHRNMNLIGYAVLIAFPSWRDRSALTRVLRTIPAEIRRHPERLGQELARPQQLTRLPSAVVGAFEHFQRQMRADRRMLLGHRFWSLVRSIDAQLEEERHGVRAVRWTLEARFGGWEQDVLELRLSRRTVRGAPIGEDFEGSLQDLVAVPTSDLPTGLAKAVEQGALIFGEGPGASWILDDEGAPDDALALVLARDDSVARRWPFDAAWKPLGDGWWVSGKLDALTLAGLCQALGYGRDGDGRLADLTLTDGVKTGRAAWLGRPGLLPTVSASRTSRVSIRPLQGSTDIVTLSRTTPKWRLQASEPVSGRWLLSAAEGPDETDKVLVLEADAPERWEWPEVPTGKFALDADLAFANGRPESLRTLAVGPGARLNDPEPLAHLLEAVYAGAPSLGWAESKLVPLLEPHLPRPHFVWDVLRALAEAGWLEPYASVGWRARYWRLRQPTLLPLSPRTALVEGAVAAAAEHRLAEAVSRHGGRLTRQLGLSEWAPSVLLIEIPSIADLADVLSWPVLTPHEPEFAAAPRCWPEEPRTTRGRELAGVWSFELGLFLTPEANHKAPSEVVLQRWVRERKDDRDLYRVVSEEEDFITSSRTVAVLEAHRRRGTALFRWSGGRLERVSRNGHLPLLVARSLRRRSLLGSGPAELGEGVGGYLYAADARAARWLRAKFGRAIEGAPREDEWDPLRAIVAARRANRRPSWYAAPPPTAGGRPPQ